jgi:hypothetical protein
MITVVHYAVPDLPPLGGDQPPQPTQEEEFVAHMQTIRDMYATLWQDMRAYRRVGPGQQSLGIFFDLTIQFALPDTGRVYKEFKGFVDDLDEEVGTPATLCVSAESKDMNTRQIVSLWEDNVVQDLPPVLVL